jgi:protein-disulfide isomerase
MTLMACAALTGMALAQSAASPKPLAPAKPAAPAAKPSPPARPAPQAAARPVAASEPQHRTTVLLFSDFECPFCANLSPMIEQIRKEFGSQVDVVFKHTPLPIHPHAFKAAEAAIEAQRQGKFWEMHDLLFADQAHLTIDDLIARGAKLGMNVPRLRAALKDGRHRAAVEANLTEARALGVTATPTLFINGQRMVGVPKKEQLQAALRQPSAGDSSGSGGEPFNIASLDYSDSPVRGAPDAPVTIVAFSDFQCPFCARSLQTIEAIGKAYPGRVRLIFKHFPLVMHTQAPLAHKAALAAHAQGKFWEMHDLLFTHQNAVRRDDLLRYASMIGLDEARFAKDLDAGADYSRLVERDITEGKRAGVDGTPIFFVNNERVEGAQPFAEFKTLIDRELARTARAAFTKPVPGDTTAARLLESAMSYGPTSAKVTIQWYADLGSPLHRDAVALMKRLVAKHPGDVHLSFFHRPLDGRDDGRFPHEATLAAAEQGKFWEIHDLLVARPAQDRAALAANAVKLGVDRAWFEESLQSGRPKTELQRQVAAAKQAHILGTPTFVVNGRRIDGLVSDDELEAIVTAALGTTTVAAK